MPFEPMLVLNAASQISVAVASLLLVFRLKCRNECILKKPFYFLSGSLFVIALLNILWYADVFGISEMENLLIGPLFHLAIMSIWFYIAIFISLHRHVYMLIPIFLMSINAILILQDLAVFCDIIISIVLIGIFFHAGFIKHKMMSRLSIIGMLYGFSVGAVSIATHFLGIPYLYSFWFIPNVLLLWLVIAFLLKGHPCDASQESKPHHIPVMVEVAKLGVFIVCLSVFLMLGTLGIHEMGHSLAAGLFGCSHTTTFGTGFAKTHIMCSDSTGLAVITLGGPLLSLGFSLMIYFMGNDFAQRMSFLLVAFSIIISFDDLISIDIPYSVMVLMVFMSAAFIGYGIVLIVKNYELEYDRYEAKVCASISCGRQTYLKPRE